MADRPTILLYTDEAKIEPDVRAAMIEAGYLPVQVASVDAVRVLESPVFVEAAQLDAMSRTCLQLMHENPGSTVTTNFGAKFSGVILAGLARTAAKKVP